MNIPDPVLCRAVWRELLADGAKTCATYARARVALGLDLPALAAILEVPTREIARWEDGSDRPSRCGELALAALLTPGALGLAQKRFHAVGA